MLDRKSLVECRRSEHRHVSRHTYDSIRHSRLFFWVVVISNTQHTRIQDIQYIYTHTCRGLVTYRTARHLEWLCFEEDTLRDGGGNNPAAHDDKVEPF